MTEGYNGKPLRDYYVGGAYKKYLCKYRDLQFDMNYIDVSQPEGVYPHCSSDEIWVSVQTAGHGKATLDLGAGRYATVIRPGDVLVRAPGAEGNYSIHHAHSFKLLCIPVSENARLWLDELECASDDLAKASSGPIQSALIKDIIVGIETLGCSALLVESAAVMVLAELKCHSRKMGFAKSFAGGLPPVKRDKIIGYMRDNIEKEIILSELAALVGMDRFYLIKAFKKTLGTTPHRYLSELRIEFACSLLKTTRLSIAEVAARTGLGTRENLYRAMSRHVGVSPREFRRNP